jgi:crotonobetainyl-CoA:carnitine CoA-transferase CaiB-like acyl-CoA transferase
VPIVSVLDGVKVVDFTTAMAGPHCTMMLADFGAEVIKVEPPEGETGRAWGKNRFGNRGQFSGLFAALNRNKSSVTLDLKSEKGQEGARKLLSSADVVLEGYKPGVADRLGVGYQTVQQYNPSVVYCSISGFGQDGPLRERPGFDMLMQAYVGHMSVTGEEGRPSIRSGPSAIDLLTGANAAFGIMLALFERQRSGHGQYLETSLYDAAIEMVAHFLADYSGSGEVPAKSGRYFAFSSPYGVFDASDREVYMGVAHQGAFTALCKAISREDLLSDPRFTTNGDRIANREDIHKELFGIFASRTAQEWVDLCVQLGIPACLVERIDEVAKQPQAAARAMLVDSGIDGVLSAGIAVKMHGTPGAVYRPVPDLGADNARLIGDI